MTLLICIYAALAVFCLVNLYRILRIAAMPVHLRWELYPVPHEPADKSRYGGSYFEESEWWTKAMQVRRTGELKIVLSEIFLLKGVWQHNRPLWLWSWLLHIALYLLIAIASVAFLSALIGTIGAEGGGRTATPTAPLLFGPILYTSWLAMSCGLVGAVGLLVLRARSRRLRPFTSFGTVFNLALLLVVFVSGFLALLSDPETVGQMIRLAGSLLRPGDVPHIHGILAMHLTAAVFFLAYFPFTHMTHMYLKYFMYHSVRWDDRPSENNPALAERVAGYMKYPMAWSAPHIRGDGIRNWADITSEPKQERE